MSKINIAIDGHSSCGKSTIAKALAKELGYIYVDSGAMYRSVTLYALKHDLIENGRVDEPKLLLKLHKIKIEFHKVGDKQHTFLNGKDVESKIRSIEVAQNVSMIAKISQVRKFLVKIQQYMGREKGVVMDGRDIGTVVFPSAEVKFFVTANVEVRAKRRYQEMLTTGFENVSLDDIRSNIEERDFLDSHRIVSPLIRANDAILIDTSDMTQEEQLETAYNEVKKLLV